LALLLVGSAVAGVLAISAIGVGGAWLATVIGVASVWITGGALAGAYVAGAWGLGGAALRWMDDRASAAWLAPAIGLGLMLAISHGLGVLGAFDWFGAGGRRVVAGLPIGVGLVLLAMDLAKRREDAGGVHPAALAAIPGVAVLLVAAASPPGWLWASEGLGYDTRSYHAQLPAEWLAMGRLWPVEHNVYAFLPGYMEAGFYHLAAIVGTHPAAGSGVGLMSFQCLSAVVTVLAVVLLGRVCWLVVPQEAHKATGGVATAVAALVLATPWIFVTGSLAYNEPAVLALGAGAVLAALSVTRSHAARWGLAAFLVGSACGAKPTALFMVGPVVGAVLVATTPARSLVKAAVLGAGVGLATLLPWLVRNEMAAGNPVFPQLAGVFGPGHWTAEQHARWASGHAFGGSVFDRVRLLFLPDSGGPFLGGTSMRGLLHPQWGLLGAACVLAACAAPFVRRHAVVVALAAGLLIQLLAWLWLTHLQSRFLMPIVLAGAPLIVVVLARFGGRGVWVAVGLALAQGAWGVWSYSGEGRGRPGLAIAPGVAVFTGELAPEESPQGAVNFGLGGARGRVLLVGDGAPLYYLGGPAYTTTWDAGLLLEALEASPGDAAAQAAALRAAGVRWVIIDEMELSRLRESGWLHGALTPRAVGELADQGRPMGYWPGPGALGRILIDLGPP
jgi:hypothetical protein